MNKWLGGLLVAFVGVLVVSCALVAANTRAQESIDGTHLVLVSAVEDIAQLKKMCGTPCLDYQTLYGQEINRQIDERGIKID